VVKGFCLSQRKRVAHLFFFGSQIRQRVRVGGNFTRKLFDDLDTCINQRAYFSWIISEQAHVFDSKVTKNSDGEAKVSMIRIESQRMIGLDRIQTLILKRISLQLRHQTNAAAFLLFINHETATGLANDAHGNLQLLSTVTAERS